MRYKDKDEFRRALISRSFILAKRTIKVVERLPKKPSAWVVSDQMLRAITSIGANIIEAQAASSRRDFVKFINYALKSANEAKFWLFLCKEIDKKIHPEVDQLLRETKELANILGSSIANIRGKKKK